MTPEQLEHFTGRLVEEKTRLRQELDTMGAKDPTQPGHYITEYPESGSNSEDDNAGEIAEYADELSIEANLERELRDVTKALASVEKGTYGTCKYCSKDIDLKRLEARPASSSCISCKKILTQEL
ncbi:MAG: TraR/DksA family transcriptional regulator [bacterium]|nr:TraR/DksA family transcriptional regulator [bacterium]